MLNSHISKLKERLDAIRPQLIDHPLYKNVHTIQQLQTFTQYHIFAVWDFMSLLKSLQSKLTCTTTPWMPVGTANTRYLINEIVLGEESDVDQFGNRISHFELYINAMEQLGSDTTSINQLLTFIQNGIDINEALKKTNLSSFIQEFVGFTFDIIEHQPDYVQAAVFTFGREDLIPDMFIGLVKELSVSNADKISTFKYYLERHIEVDGDHHSHLAMQMVADLCGDDSAKWEKATIASIEAIEQRIKLWDAINNVIMDKTIAVI
jgi:hypothetical protein